VTNTNILVTRDPILTKVNHGLVFGATILAAGFGNLIIGPLALAALVAEALVLVVCLKNFTCHTKYLKIFYV